MCHLYPYNDVKLLRKFFYINLYYHHHSRHPSLHHSFTLSLQALKPTFSTNVSHLRLLLPTGLPSWQRDWNGPIMLIVLFLVSHFNFLFVPCGRLSCNMQYSFIKKTTKRTSDKRNNKHEWWNDKIQKNFFKIIAGYSSAFYCTLNTHYHIVSHCIVSTENLKTVSIP